MKKASIQLFVAIFIVLLVWGCKNIIYDDLSDCPQGIAFRFRSQTPCGDSLSLEKLKDLSIYVIDENKERILSLRAENVTIIDDYTLTLPFLAPGTYTFVFWGMENEDFYEESGVGGIRLKKNKIPVSETLPALFYGTRVYTFIDRTQLGTQIDTLEINMEPYVYKIDVKVRGIEDSENYTIELVDNNAQYDYRGKIIPTPIRYSKRANKNSDNYQATLSSQKLVRNGATVLCVRDVHDKIVIEIPLERVLQEIEKTYGEAVNLDCIYYLNFTIFVDSEINPDTGTYTSFRVTLNKWNVVFREINLG